VVAHRVVSDMEIELKDALYLFGIAMAAVVTFFTTKHQLKEFVMHKYDELKERIHKLEIENERLKAKDDLQQQVIDQFRSQILDKVPDMVTKELAKHKGSGNE
jgi:hypothetical protein